MLSIYYMDGKVVGDDMKGVYISNIYLYEVMTFEVRCLD